MGYRSCLYVKIPNKDVKEFDKLLQDSDLDLAFEKQEVEDDSFQRYAAYDLKWYDSFDDVKKINQFIETENPPNGPRGMLRIGEDNETEEYGDTIGAEIYPYVTVKW